MEEDKIQKVKIVNPVDTATHWLSYIILVGILILFMDWLGCSGSCNKHRNDIYQVVCYSNDKIIYEGESIGIIHNGSFTDKATKKEIIVTGNCVFKQTK